MSFHSYENRGSDGTMAEGDYEVQLVNCAETKTRTSGTECIAFDFVVRKDVLQRYQGKHIFKNFFRGDDGEWPAEKIGKIANALGVEKDAEFELIDLIGRCCILHMRPFQKRDGTMVDTIYFSAPTKAGQLIQFGSPSDFTEADDEELPF